MADIKSTVFNLTNTLAKSSGDFVKNTKLNIDLANQEEQLKSIYIEIGKKVHEIYTFGGTLGAAFDDLHRDLVICEGQIRDLRKRIDAVKGVSTCLKCGKNVDRKSEFCPGCGTRMYPAAEFSTEIPKTLTDTAPTPEPLVIEHKDEPRQEDEPTVRKCISCGAENPSGIRFCLGCGRIIGG